ncbi:Fis family transcriptional regulator [Floricoccus tropicus]|uniref:Fis family transcriptional regulator n=1 Tax=Floricoccus tropicus TaxID=1859473 RepID=A0A1E8GNR9_9LACT|nr:response regulator [Floricoccus tropicus]OFI49914.1 Fis family transcriptional regulator [Floricoccus tropicus]
MNGRIVIVDDEPLTRMDIRGLLEDENYEVVGEASDGISAIEICRKQLPDLVIMDIKMPILDGLKASKKIMTDKLAKAVVIMSAHSDRHYIEQAKKYGVGGFVVKPVDEKSFIPTIEVSMANGQVNQELKSEVNKLAKKLSDRKIIEKAKGIIMEENSLSEEEAYQRLRSISMDKRCSMIDIAEMIVAND